MMIEIRGAGFKNKGAELMLLSALHQMRQAFPSASFAMAPSGPRGNRPFIDFAKLGIYPKASFILRGMECGQASALIPRRLRDRFGLVLDREVDLVLDASGFAYGDQWGGTVANELAHAVRRWKRRGTTVVLLPQAFGPFHDAVVRRAMKRAIDYVDLVMPRDEVSYRSLVDLVGERETIKRFPDFTNLIEGVVPDWFDADAHRVAVVPNCRMLDMADEKTREQYLPFMTSCVKRLLVNDARPFLLVHEGADDELLAEKIASSCGKIPVFKGYDALTLKGILGECRAVLASRFHALVSALSQGVPSLATGWSHKYAELMKDYGFSEGLIPVTAGVERIDASIAAVLDDVKARETRACLCRESDRLKAESREMWATIERRVSRGTER